jgi:hypothetical protein
MTPEADTDFDRARIAPLGEIMDSWCVWSKFGKRPCYWHRTQKAAEREARRLALKYPKQKFIVLHAVSKFGAAEADVAKAEAA